MNYYDHNIGDFASMTQGLDLESIGICIRLLDRFMLTEKPIKTQWVSLAFPKELHEKVFLVLSGLFDEVEDGWVYGPYVELLERYAANRLKNKENGKKGGRPRKTQENHVGSDGFPTETQNNPVGFSGFSTETQTQPNQKATSNQKPITNISTATPPVVPPHDFEPELPMEAEAPKAEPKPDRAMVPFPSELPQQWLEDAKRVRTDIDPNAVFLKMKARFVSTTQRKTLGGWHKNWMTWIGREFPTNSAQRSSSGFAKSDKRFTVNQDEYYQNCMNPDGTVNYGI